MNLLEHRRLNCSHDNSRLIKRSGLDDRSKAATGAAAMSVPWRRLDFFLSDNCLTMLGHIRKRHPKSVAS